MRDKDSSAQTILSNLVSNHNYARKVLPYLREDYFQSIPQKVAYKLIDDYYGKYNQPPSKKILVLELEKSTGLSEDGFEKSKIYLEALDVLDVQDEAWLTNHTESFCQDAAITNAIHKSIMIYEGEDKDTPRSSIPQLLTDALAVSFDNSIGHDYTEDYEERYAYYHSTVAKIPFKLEMLNTITNGGFARKTLNLFLAGTNVGKTLVMGSLASDYLLDGKNVLYITLEVSQEEIGRRIDANLLDVPIQYIETLSAEVFQKKMERVRERTTGKIIVKEYPTGAASAQDFKNLIKELKLKKGFMPDVVIIDYLNICRSYRVKDGFGDYRYVKSIAEELRALAVELDVVLISATQTNRSGFTDSDMDLDSTSESFGVPMTADFMLAVISTEELQNANLYQGKQLKSRYRNPGIDRRFMIGVDRSKMRIFDVEQKRTPGSKPKKSLIINTEDDEKDEVPTTHNNGASLGSILFDED